MNNADKSMKGTTMVSGGGSTQGAGNQKNSIMIDLILFGQSALMKRSGMTSMSLSNTMGQSSGGFGGYVS